MSTVIVTVILLSGDVYHFDVPFHAPLYAVSDLLAREILQPAESMIYFREEERISRYSAVVEDMTVRVLITHTAFFYAERIDGKLWYYREGQPEEKKEWDSDAVELEDSLVFSKEEIDNDKGYTVRRY